MPSLDAEDIEINKAQFFLYKSSLSDRESDM
jgi:hypothetical protein